MPSAAPLGNETRPTHRLFRPIHHLPTFPDPVPLPQIPHENRLAPHILQAFWMIQVALVKRDSVCPPNGTRGDGKGCLRCLVGRADSTPTSRDFKRRGFKGSEWQFFKDGRFRREHFPEMGFESKRASENPTAFQP